MCLLAFLNSFIVIYRVKLKLAFNEKSCFILLMLGSFSNFWISWEMLFASLRSGTEADRVKSVCDFKKILTKCLSDLIIFSQEIDHFSRWELFWIKVMEKESKFIQKVSEVLASFHTTKIINYNFPIQFNNHVLSTF